MRISLLVLIGMFGYCPLHAEKLSDFKPLEKNVQSRIIRFYDFDKNIPGWKLPDNYRLTRGEGMNGTGALILSRRSGERYVFARQLLSELTPGQRYRLSGDIRITGVLGSDGKPPKTALPVLGMDFSRGGKWVGSAHIRISTVDGSCDWTTASTDFVVPEKSHAAVCFFLTSQYSCSQIAWDNVKIELLGDEPPVLYPVLPKHLKLDNTGEIKLRVADFAEGRSDDSLCVFACLKDGRELSSTVVNGFAGFKLGKLPEGTHEVEFFAVDGSACKVIGEAAYSFTMTNSTPPAGAVETDESGRITVDGKPFFPVGFFLEQPLNFTNDDLTKLREAGVNTLLPYRSIRMLWPKNKGEIGLAAVKKSMDMLHRNNIKIIFSLLELTGQIHSIDRYDNITDKAALTEYLVKGLKDHPALLSWYISDENPVSGLGPVRELRSLVSRLDPFHPVSTLTYRAADFVHFGPTGDLMMIDFYPVVNAASQSMTGIRECFEVQEKVCRLGAWFVPQSFNWGLYRNSEKFESFRYPTEQEMRSHCLLALNWRVRGICFYAYDSIKNHERFDPGASERFWPQVAAVTRLLSELTPFFLADDKPQPVNLTSTGKSRIDAKFHTAEGKSIVVITSEGPGEGNAVLETGRTGLKSRFGLTRELGGGRYEFKGENTASDILE